jgi:DNA-binding beta-propeller fold protein YncE
MICNWQTVRGARRLLVVAGLLLSGGVMAQEIPVTPYWAGANIGDSLAMPSDVAVSPDGKTYVVDGGNHQVAVFDATGARVATLGMRGEEEGQFESPLGVDVNRKGDVFVADKGNNRLQMFADDGRFRRAMPLEEDGEEVVPVDVAVSADGKELFVTANNTHRVVVFDNKGRYLRGWGGEGEDDGQFRFPATIALDASGNVLVVDVLNARVQKFSPDGTFMSSFGGLGGKPGTFYRPKGIAVDESGNAYVSDSFLGAIQVFNADGELQHIVGEGTEVKVLHTPVGMTVNGNSLYVVQMRPGNVVVLQPGSVDGETGATEEMTP